MAAQHFFLPEHDKITIHAWSEHDTKFNPNIMLDYVEWERETLSTTEMRFLLHLLERYTHASTREDFSFVFLEWEKKRKVIYSSWYDNNFDAP